MVSNLVQDQIFPLSAGRYGVAVSWDKGGQAVDVDLQAIVVDNRGTIIDAVYYNNLKALRCITHSGDEQTGEKSGLDEVVWVGLTKLPPTVKMILFVVATHTGHLRDVRNGMIHLLEEKPSNEVAKFAMENSEEEVDLVAAMIRSDAGGWNLSVVDEPAQDGRHFIDILEPCIGNFVRKHIPGAPRRQKVAFAMEKGAVFDLPQSNQMQNISACLGWDVAGDGVDLDVSAVLLTNDGRPIDAVFFGNLSAHGLEHSGDNLTGEGSGDDERIVCNLDQIPKQASQIFFVVNIYTRGVTFERVSNAYCRIVDSSEIELARYSLSEGQQQNGLLISRLFREVDGRWGFQAIGSFTKGRTWKDALPDIQATFGQRPQALQLRGASTMMFSGAAGGYESSPSPSAPPPLLAPPRGGARPVQGAEGQECCNVQ